MQILNWKPPVLDLERPLQLHGFLGFYCKYGRPDFQEFQWTGPGNVATLSYFATYVLTQGHDSFYTAYSSSNGDPFGSGIIVDSQSGNTSGLMSQFTYDISPCAAGTCTIGFRLTSDSAALTTGIALVRV